MEPVQREVDELTRQKDSIAAHLAQVRQLLGGQLPGMDAVQAPRTNPVIAGDSGLVAKLDACEGIPAGGVPAALYGVLRDLVLAARELAGPAWLDAASDDPGIAAFTALQATPVPPSAAELDEVISGVLWGLARTSRRPRCTPDPLLQGTREVPQQVVIGHQR